MGDAHPGEPRRKSRFRRFLALSLFLSGLGGIGWGAYVFAPLLLSGDDAPERDFAAAEFAVYPGASRNVRAALPLDPGAAPAGEVQEAITLFNGDNPTVFESGPDNPVRFRGDVGSGVAQIGTNSTSSGARAIIGAGISQRLQGRTVRAVFVLRAAPENGAANVRFAYQRGRTLSGWQVSELGADFATIGLIWDVPGEGEANANDYLVIEPGIPGDGTAVEIRSITLEILS